MCEWCHYWHHVSNQILGVQPIYSVAMVVEIVPGGVVLAAQARRTQRLTTWCHGVSDKETSAERGRAMA